MKECDPFVRVIYINQCVAAAVFRPHGAVTIYQNAIHNFFYEELVRPTIISKGIAMPDPVTVEGNPPADPHLNISSTANRPECERNRNIHYVIGVCSLALVGCFFLPWIRLFLVNLSGYQLQQIPNNEVKFIWLIPASALLALFATITKKGVSTTSQLAGAMPFVGLVYSRFRLGEGLFELLEIGAYLALFLGVVLFVIPRFLIKPRR